MRAANGRDELAIQLCKLQGEVTHDRHVQGPLRVTSFRDSESMFACQLNDGWGKEDEDRKVNDVDGNRAAFSEYSVGTLFSYFTR